MATKKDKKPIEATQDPDNTGASSAAVYDKTAEEIAATQAVEKASADAEPQEATASTTKVSPIEQEGRKILADYPEAEAVYMTVDGFGFFDEHDAREHARRLSDKDVVTVKNE